MGERVKIDDRWRIVIPKKFRRGMRTGGFLIIERRGDVLLLRKKRENELAKRFEEIKLKAEEGRDNWDAEIGKHRYGGAKE